MSCSAAVLARVSNRAQLGKHRYMASAKQRQIDWASAEMHGGTLSVPIIGEAPKEWAKRFEGVLALLRQNPSGWGKIGLTKKAIEVADVRAGAEEELHHLLESALMQVNADLLGAADAPSQEPEDPAEQADRRIAETFRGFAPAED